MKILNKNISEFRNFFLSELSDLYDENEIKSIFNILIEQFAGLSRTEILLNPEQMIDNSVIQQLNKSFEELKKNMPVQYIIGKVFFDNLELDVKPGVLIPRPETEELIGIISKRFLDKKDEQLNILDIGCGSGCISIALKTRFPNWNVFALDISDEALTIAKQNAKKNSAKIIFAKQNILEQTKISDLPSFDLIVSNPPYVCESEKQVMRKNVIQFEPEKAIFVNDNAPFIFYEAILNFTKNHYKDKTSVFVEINERFPVELSMLFETNGFINIEILKDIHEKSRFISCEYLKK